MSLELLLQHLFFYIFTSSFSFLFFLFFLFSLSYSCNHNFSEAVYNSFFTQCVFCFFVIIVFLSLRIIFRTPLSTLPIFISYFLSKTAFYKMEGYVLTFPEKRIHTYEFSILGCLWQLKMIRISYFQSAPKPLRLCFL